LAHDDVLDDGDVRRGLASLPGYFGAPLAAAVGGVFFGRALGLFASCGDEAVTLATQTAMRMCEGQMLELRSLRDLGRTPAEYFDAVAGKTAGMFWLATQLGGALGEADPATQDALALYGEALGIAYQVIDDILDITAGQQRTGKSHGNDLHNGNYTLPVIYALEECPDLAELLRNDAETQTVVDRLLDTRAIARACADARRWIQQATDAVTALPAAGGLLEIASAELGLLSGVPA
jgi:heptaprenyl diphosphate synthase